MDYVTVRELREKSGEIWQRVEAGEEFVVTRNGKPIALVVNTKPSEVEQRLRDLRLSAFARAWDKLSEQAQANGMADELTDADIEAEIQAARQETQRAAGGA